MHLSVKPVACASLLIRRPADIVYDALVKPNVAKKFCFSYGTEELVVGAVANYFGDHADGRKSYRAIALQPNEYLAMDGPTRIEWVFRRFGKNETIVDITESGFTGSDEEQMMKAVERTRDLTLLLASCTAYLERRTRIYFLNNIVKQFLNVDACPSQS